MGPPWLKGCQQAPGHPLLGSQAPRAPWNSDRLPCKQWVTRFLILEIPQIPAGKWDLSKWEGGREGLSVNVRAHFNTKGDIPGAAPHPSNLP